MQKRYEIKRVKCPKEKCPISRCTGLSKCKYGDTKQQLINKVQTVLIKELRKFKNTTLTVNELGRRIVEYLGINE